MKRPAPSGGGRVQGRGQVGDQVGGVLDAARQPDESGRRVVAPLRPPVRGGVQPAERCRGEDQARRRQEPGHPLRADRGRTRRCRESGASAGRRPRYDGSPASPGQRTPSTSERSPQQRGDRGRVGCSAGPAAGPAWPATGAPARRRTLPGTAAGVRPPRPQPAEQLRGVRRHVTEQQVGMPGQRLGAGGDHQVGAELQRAADRAASPSCCRPRPAPRRPGRRRRRRRCRRRRGRGWPGSPAAPAAPRRTTGTGRRWARSTGGHTQLAQGGGGERPYREVAVGRAARRCRRGAARSAAAR